MMKCPICSEFIREGNLFCEKCGASIGADVASVDANAAIDKTFCTKCGAPQKAENKFCENCGSLLDIPFPSPVSAKAEESSSRQVCSRCGKTSPTGYKFCIGCGAILGAAPISEEQFVSAPEMNELADPLPMESSGKHRRSKKIVIISIFSIVAAFSIAAVLYLFVLPQMNHDGNYITALSLLESGDYPGAAAAFEALGDYKDAPEQAKEAAYREAVKLLKNNQIDSAISAFNRLGAYENVPELLKEATYKKAKLLFEQKDYEAAFEAFTTLGSYMDAEDLTKEAGYKAAEQILALGDNDAAIKAFEALGDYRDAAKRAEELNRPQPTTFIFTALTNRDVGRAFSLFYKSYIDALNKLDANLLDHCSEACKASLQDRFSINQNAIFENVLIEIDLGSINQYFDLDIPTVSFVAQCSNNMWRRNTNAYDSLNVAVWRATARYHPEREVWYIDRAERVPDNERILHGPLEAVS